MQTPYRSLFLRGLAISALVLGTARAAHAQDAGDDLAALQKNLADEQVALSTADCSMACRALGSIRRVADRICALDPGEPCTSARTKAEDATRRVREACPDCAVAAIAPPPPMPVAKEATMTTDSGPPSESKRGGCAGCTTAASTSDPTSVAGLVVAVAALGFRRRSRRRNMK
ncbi:MAG: hypothetical protein JWM74_3883 [Myxococcaceae bacterium]|jgi:MYXO-CTERM domain-containing protein|nr:hypothetical protein [Myxococcaceae bacterium]